VHLHGLGHPYPGCNQQPTPEGIRPTFGSYPRVRHRPTLTDVRLVPLHTNLIREALTAVAGATEKIDLPHAAAVVDTLVDRFGINVADIGDRSVLEARIDKVTS
jgi:hypothetical protein